MPLFRENSKFSVSIEKYNGHELGQTSGDGDGQKGLVCCSPGSCKVSDMTGLLNNSNNRKYVFLFLFLDLSAFIPHV